MYRRIPHLLALFAGLLFPGTHDQGTPAAQVKARSDPRLIRLKAFLREKNCPVHVLAPEFLAASDRHGLDWRLLPSIALVESGGGKAYRNNNIMGWASGKTRFASIGHGIHAVASRLAHSPLYRGKNLDALLVTYNPVPGYVNRVKRVMRMIGEPGLPASPLTD